MFLVKVPTVEPHVKIWTLHFYGLCMTHDHPSNERDTSAGEVLHLHKEDMFGSVATIGGHRSR